MGSIFPSAATKGFLMNNDAFSQCHPLTNFLFFVGAIGFCAVIQHPIYLLAGAAGAAGYYLLLNGRKGWKLIGGLIPVFAVLSALNPLLNTYGKTELFTVFGRPYTMEALLYGMVIAGMLAVMILWFGCYSAVLTSDKFVCLFGGLIPSLSLLLVMILRMIPSLTRRAKQISDTRKSIGKGLTGAEGNKEKIQGGMRILSALTDWALEGSIVTADSMRSRGYGCAKRSSFQVYRFTVRDSVLIGLMAVFSLGTMLFGGVDAEFTPEIHVDNPTWGLVCYCAFLVIPLLLHGKEAVCRSIALKKV